MKKLVLTLMFLFPCISAMKEEAAFDWNLLPTEIQLAILSFVPQVGSYRDYKNLSLTSKSFKALVNEPQFQQALVSAIVKQNPVLADKIYQKALLKDDVPVVKRLLIAGLDPNKRFEEDKTSLMIAAELNYKNLAKLLYDRKADVNAATKSGKTALMLAAQKGFSDMIKQLLLYGASIDAQDRFGNTALILAVINKQDDSARTLIDKKADPNLRNKLRKSSAIDIAARQGNEEIVKLLQERGADISGIPVLLA